MTVSSTPRPARTSLSPNAQRSPSRSGRGYRIVAHPVRQAAVETGTELHNPGRPSLGLAGRLWQRLCALWQRTPEQWYAQHMARQARADESGLRGRVLISSGQAYLVSASNTSGFSRRPAQPDLP